MTCATGQCPSCLLSTVQRLLEWDGEVLLAWAVISGQEAMGLHLATDKQAEQSGDTRGA